MMWKNCAPQSCAKLANSVALQSNNISDRTSIVLRRRSRKRGNSLKRPDKRKNIKKVLSPIKGVTLMHGDIIDALASISDQKFDLIISSPPYNIGKSYERTSKRTFPEYLQWQDKIIATLVERLTPNGSICWQVGSYVKDGESIPLDVYSYLSFRRRGLKLRNRIVWKFNFGLHSSRRFSGRYETLLWFTKSDSFRFNLNPVRVPQLYPGKRHSKNRKGMSGKPSGNPRGKNPGDYWEFSAEQHFVDNPVWDIPNVKANHPEKTSHPCQFPVELVERCILAFTKKGGKILDPFVGTGTSLIAAVKHGRVGVGIDHEKQFLKLAAKRLAAFQNGSLKIRPIGKPVSRPNLNQKVARVPEEWGRRTKHKGR